MQFLYPIGLLALASLAIPILIHLWRIKQGKTLKIGSTSLLGMSAASNARSWRINEWLLFLLRCALLILAVFLLAKPYLKGSAITGKGGWILVNQQEFGATYSTHHKTIDSLLNKGYQIHNFGYGFDQLRLKDTLNTFRDSLALSSVSLLKQANYLLSNRYPVWVFSSKNSFPIDDELPELHLQLHWQTSPAKDSLSSSYVQFLNRNYKAETSPYSTRYTTVNDQKQDPIHVMVYPAESEDARYVKAALAAIGDYSEQQIVFHGPSQNTGNLDVLFWLTDQAIDPSLSKLLKKNGVLFQYANGKINTARSFMVFDQETPQGPDLVQVFKSITKKKNDDSETLWKDGFGNPLLTLAQNEVHSYTLYSRLNPKWTDLVWKDVFVKCMLPIIYAEKPQQFGFEQTTGTRLTGDEPISSFTDNPKAKALTAAPKPLDQFLWVLALVILFVERFLSFKRKSNLKQA